MYKIFYDNNQFVILVDGVQNSSGELLLEHDKLYVLTLLPIYEGSLFLPISATAKMTDGELCCTISHVKLEENQYYLLPKFAPYLHSGNPRVEIQREFGEHTITVFTDKLPKLLIENKTNFCTVTLPEYPEKLQEAVLDSGVLFYALCPHYLCVIMYDYNDYNVLIDTECDSYTFTEDGIDYVTHLHDNQGRIYKCSLTFDGKQYVPTTQKFEYSNAHETHADLIPFDFAEACLAEDFDYCANLLSPNCSQSMDDIAKIFEEACDLVLPNCPLPKNTVLLKLAGGKLAKCKFLLKYGLISGISLV